MKTNNDIKWTKEFTREYLKHWRNSHPHYSRNRYREKIKPFPEEYEKVHKKNLKNAVLLRRKYRYKIIQKLGYKCCKCGYCDIRALQIDHVYGRGRKEYEETGKNSPKYYRQILEAINSGSKSYQLLCSNCNWIKRYDNNEDNHNEPVIGVVSGYFNPLHIGHLDYINDAYNYCDKLIVIVNTDKQVKIKDSYPFMNENDRFKIIKNLKAVDDVIFAIDKDGSVCETLKMLKPDLFLKGGDRTANNIPEYALCKELDIKLKFNIGGKKVRSSSNLVKKGVKQ